MRPNPRRQSSDNSNANFDNRSKTPSPQPSFNQNFPQTSKHQIQNSSRYNETSMPNAQKQNFEEIPVGKSLANTMMDEYPSDYVPTKIAVEEILPLIKRIYTKVWRGRVQAYMQLIQAFNKGELFDEFQLHLHDFISDAQFQAQEKGFKILLVYISKRSKINIDMKPIFKAIIQKGITAKPQIVKLAQDSLVELFQKSEQLKTMVIASLLQGTNNKNSKIVSGCIDAVIPLLNNYGLARLQYLKPFIRQIQKYNENNIDSVKKSISNFFKEAYKWIGEPLWFTVNKFKKSVQNQLKTFISTYEQKPMVPLRVSQSEQAMAKQQKGFIFDAYSMATPVNVIDKFDERWCNHTLDLEKWVEKKSAIDVAVEAFSVPKIVPKDYMHLVGFISRLLTDSNFNVNVSALKLLRNMATGLRKHFAQGAKCLYKQILFKLRDKKQIIVEEIHRVLQSFLFCMTLDEMIEKVKENLNDKAPNMKIQTLNFIKNSFKQKKQVKAAKSLIDYLKNLMNDATAEVREKSFEVLCRIKAVFGVQTLGKIDDWKNIPKDKLARIKNEPQITLTEENDPEVMNNKNGFGKHERSISLDNINIKKALPVIEVKRESIKSIQPLQNKKINRNTQNIPIPVVFNSPLIQNSPIRNQAIKHSDYYRNISSDNEKTRQQAYNNLLFYPNQIDYIVLRSVAYSESAEYILKLIISLVERSFSTRPISKQALEFLIMHNWNGYQQMIGNLFRCLHVQERHYYIIQGNQKLYNIFSQTNENGGKQQLSINQLIKKLYEFSLLYKIDNKKATALQKSLQLVSSWSSCKNKTIGEHPDDNANLIQQIIINLKALLFDKSSNIVQDTIQLSGDLVKICVITKMKGKVLLPIIIRKIDTPGLQGVISSFLYKCLDTQASFLFTQLACQLPSIKGKQTVLEFIQCNIDIYIMGSTQDEIKTMLLVIFECLKQTQDIATVAEQIIDSLLSSTGMSMPPIPSKVDIPTKYLRKYKLEPLMISSRFPPKSDRLRLLNQNNDPWTLKQLNPAEIQKLFADLSQLPQPHNGLISAFPIQRGYLNKVFVTESFSQYSDFYIQWLFWKFHTERIENVLILIEMTQKILLYLLTDLEISIILSGEQTINGVCYWSKIFYQQNKEKEIAAFYINALQSKPQLLNHILKILIRCYPQELNSYLPLLSQIQALKRNKEFIEYLRSTHSHSVIQAYGFQKFDPQPIQIQRISQKFSEKNPLRVSQKIQQRHSQRTHQKMSQEVQQRNLERVSTRGPERTSQRMRQKKQQKTSFIKIERTSYQSLQFSSKNNITFTELLITEGHANLIAQVINQAQSYDSPQDFQIQAILAVLQDLTIIQYSQEYNYDFMNEFTDWLGQSLKHWQLSLDQLSRIMKTIFVLLDTINKYIKQLSRKLNPCLLILFEFSNYNDLCKCIFTAFKEDKDLMLNNKMIMLLYIKSITKSQLNTFFREDKLKAFKIMMQHTARFIEETLIGQNDEDFIHNNIKKQLLAIFNECRPDSIQLTIDVLIEFKNNYVVVNYFQFLFKSVGISNPVMVELDSNRTKENFIKTSCTYEGVSRGSRTFMQQIPSFEPSQNQST